MKGRAALGLVSKPPTARRYLHRFLNILTQLAEADEHKPWQTLQHATKGCRRAPVVSKTQPRRKGAFSKRWLEALERLPSRQHPGFRRFGRPD